jgi:hypothetical protein
MKKQQKFAPILISIEMEWTKVFRKKLRALYSFSKDGAIVLITR